MGTLLLRRCAMEKKLSQFQKTFGEVISLAYEKAVRLEKSKVSLYIPLPYLPPCPPHKATEVETTDFGKVRFYVMAAKSGGWIIQVKFPSWVIAFNPPIAREEAEKLKK